MGRRSLPDRTRANWRVGNDTPIVLNAIAINLGFSHGDGGAVGKMLDAIASGEYLVVRKKAVPNNSNVV